MPSDFLNLDEREKAFVVACIKTKIDSDKKRADAIKSRRKG